MISPALRMTKRSFKMNKMGNLKKLLIRSKQLQYDGFSNQRKWRKKWMTRISSWLKEKHKEKARKDRMKNTIVLGIKEAEDIN